MGAPWFKIHVKEFLSDSKILQLTHEQVGILLRLWCIACNDGFIPADPATLSRLIPGTTTKQMVKHLLWIKTFFSESESSPETLVSHRLQAELSAYESKVEKLRESGRRGGLVPKAKAKANASGEVKQKLKQMGPEEEGEEEKEVPTPAPSGAKRGRKPKEKQGTPTEYPEATVEAVNTIIRETPREDPQERAIRVDPATLAERVDGILRADRNLFPALLVQAWREYLDTKPAWIKAPQYFFGRQADQKDGANWHPYARLILHRNAKADRQMAEQKPLVEVA